MSGRSESARDASRQRVRVLVSSYVGSVIEWLDFYLYTIAAASVFSVLFFPSHDPVLSMMASLGSLAVAYVVRPIGGLIYGYFGDRFGRKQMLVSSILLMGLSTMLVGVLPTYNQVGFWAPVLLILLRVCQGLAVAGEWGGSVLMALEHASPRRRGLWSCFTGMGISTGLLLASGSFALLARLPQADFLSWGWRIPFLLASVLIAIGLWVRLGVEESPVFRKAQATAGRDGAPLRSPFGELFTTQWRPIVLAFLLTVGPFAISGLKTAFLTAYAIDSGVSRSAVLDATTVSSIVSVCCMLLGGWASDIFGRRPVVIVGGMVLAGVSCFVFNLMDQASAPLVMLAMCLVTASHGVMYGPLGAFISELFPTRTRYTGASIAYQTAGVLGGGFAPMIGAGLLAAAGGRPHVAYVVAFMVICALSGVVAAVLAQETSKQELTAAQAVTRAEADIPGDTTALPAP